jgi:hypothetical protein
MKLTIFRLAVALSAVAVILLTCSKRPQISLAAPQTPVTVTRLYTGPDQLSHVEQLSLNFSPETFESDHVKASTTYVVRVPPTYFQDWHHPGHRRDVLPLSGRAEIEIANGEKVAVEPGHLYLAEDQTGKGHTFRVVGGTEWVALFVDLD